MIVIVDLLGSKTRGSNPGVSGSILLALVAVLVGPWEDTWSPTRFDYQTLNALIVISPPTRLFQSCLVLKFMKVWCSV